MTIGIAAITRDDKFIVVAGDRMLSHGDVIQAADDATLKARRLSKSWGVTFAGEANRFIPILDKSIRNLYSTIAGGTDQEEKDEKLVDHSEKEVRDAITLAYRQEFEESVSAKFLAPLGYSNTDEFMKRGLADLGETAFQNILKKIETTDLGITILAYGFDELRAPYIFQISSPGVYTNHELLRCAAIGSGVYMATASLRQRPPKGNLETTVYRVLEAKFSSETASGVGRTTTLLVIDPDGKLFFLDDQTIEVIRTAWIKLTQRPDPKAAIDSLKKEKIAESLKKSTAD